MKKKILAVKKYVKIKKKLFKAGKNKRIDANNGIKEIFSDVEKVFLDN